MLLGHTLSPSREPCKCEERFNMFVWVYELQTTKHCRKINIDRFLAGKLTAGYGPSDCQEKIENNVQDFVKNRCF